MSWLIQKLNDSDGGGTRKAKAKKNYSTETQKRLAKFKNSAWSTLGTNNLAALVGVPPGEEEIEWIALNTLDFFNEIQQLVEFCQDVDEKQYKPGEGFPPGVVYKWKDGAKTKPKTVSGPDYIDKALTYIEFMFDNTSIFPDDQSNNFPDQFVDKYIKDINVKLFRVYAIVYTIYKDVMQGDELKEMGLSHHLNTSFKHFIYFGIRFKILPDDGEMEPLKVKVGDYKKAFQVEISKKVKEKQLGL